MRRQFNTDSLEHTSRSFLLHGEPGAGKTWLLGSAMAAYKPRSYILNFPGEDGLLTLQGLGLPGEDVETLEDWNAFLADIRIGKLKDTMAVGLDGLPQFYQSVIIPSLVKTEFAEPSDYGRIHSRFESQIKAIKRAVPLLFCTARSDRSMDQVRQEAFITPDLPGRMAVGVAGIMDYVFYIEADAVAGRVRRRLYTVAPANRRVITRYRTPRPLQPVYEDPTWTTLSRALQEAGVSIPAAANPQSTA